MASGAGVRVPGAKSAMGAAEQLISMMPAHTWYLEGFGGTGAVGRRKLPAAENIIIEKDDAAAAELQSTMGPGWRVIHGDVFNYARSLLAVEGTLAYFDPPYVMDTRRSSRAIYRHEFSDVDHRRLHALVTETTVRACIIISGYAGSLYEELFAGWRRREFTVMTRGGPALECAWMNYPEPTEFHDTRFMGSGFTDRQRIKRKAARWVKRLLSMPPGERAAVLEAIRSHL
jgi:DNA adenine methylase